MTASARPGAPATLRVENVWKTFGSAAALRGVSLEVRLGELLALLGPSGSGKTTLLRAVAGLETLDEGRLFLDGQDATGLPVQARGVGFVFQHYALFRHLTVFENVAYGLRARPRATRPANADIARRVNELLALVQIEALGGRFPAQLSGGQRQRVALARALAVEPRVLLLDEPFGALDARVRKDLRRWLRDIHEQTGCTTLFVTHDQDEALELADRVAVLNEGRLEQVGTPDEVHDAPRSPFVMTFLGDAVRVEARVEDGQVWIGDRRTDVAPPPGVGGAFTLFARPWDVRIVAPEAGDLIGRVRGVRRAGCGTRVDVELSSGARIEVDSTVSERVGPGERVGLRLERVRTFPDAA